MNEKPFATAYGRDVNGERIRILIYEGGRIVLQYQWNEASPWMNKYVYETKVSEFEQEAPDE